MPDNYRYPESHPLTAGERGPQVITSPTAVVVPAEPIETFAAQPADTWYATDLDMDDGELVGYFAQDLHASAVLDPMPALIAGPEPVELQAAPDYNESYQFEALEDGWHQAVYGLPD